jgi:hypothetical protein
MVLNMLTMLLSKKKIMAKFLRVAQWNANRLHPHIDEVKLFSKSI